MSEDSSLDARGIPTHACPNCGGEIFEILARFEEYDIAMWWVNGKCHECGTWLTVPTPVDDPEYQKEDS